MSDEMDARGADNPGPFQDGKGKRLPPPAFPPGKRKLHVRRRDRRGEAAATLDDALISPDEPLPERAEGADIPDDAFISPDDPIERVARAADDDAFISPDEPLPPRQEAAAVAVEEEIDAEEIRVTGIGDDDHMDPEELALGGDPHMMEISEAVSKLAAAIRSRGEAGLRATPDMTRFETTLRAYCVGYLTGRRAEEELPELEESESGSW